LSGGGSGKTRLALELCNAVSDQGWAVVNKKALLNPPEPVPISTLAPIQN
jgi:hypothetical protein